MNIQDYLDHLQMEKMENTDLLYLEKLHERHLLTVPFENLDVRRGTPINLDLDSLFNKVILNKRGGLCFEINRLFAWLLDELGYQVKICSSQVYDDSTDQFGPEFDHMVLCVYLEEIYLIDVAFGDCFRSPISLKKACTKDISGSYRIIEYKENRYELQRKEVSTWLPIYRFSTQDHRVSDFKDMADYYSSAPASHHRNHSICSIATEKGRITLSDHHLTITESGQQTKNELKSETQFFEVLNQYFGIDLTEFRNEIVFKNNF